MKSILFITVMLISSSIVSQEKRSTNSFVVTDDVDILNTPKFYRSYFSEYSLNENWFFRIEMLERSNDNLVNSYTLIEYPLLAKYYVSDRFSVLFGSKISVLKENGNINLGDISLFSTFGFQYDITEYFLVEGRVNYSIIQKPTSNTINYTTSDFVIYKVGTKLKF